MGPWSQVARPTGTVLSQRGPSPFATHYGYLIATGEDSVRIPSAGGLIVARLLMTPTLSLPPACYGMFFSFFGFVGIRDFSLVGRSAPLPFADTGAARLTMPASHTWTYWPSVPLNLTFFRTLFTHQARWLGSPLGHSTQQGCTSAGLTILREFLTPGWDHPCWGSLERTVEGKGVAGKGKRVVAVWPRKLPRPQSHQALRTSRGMGELETPTRKESGPVTPPLLSLRKGQWTAIVY